VLVGLQPGFGLGVLGAGLIIAEVVLAVAGGCDGGPLIGVAGGVVFAVSRLVLSSRGRRRVLGLR
jgi:hypothetical protein